MFYEYKTYPLEVEGRIFCVAESKVLKGCVGQGGTYEEAVKELKINEKEWIETAREFGITIPQ